MTAPTHAAPLPAKTQTLLMLRWVLIIATSYLLLFSGRGAETPPSIGLFVAAYFASNIVLTALLPRIRSQHIVNTGIVLFDTAAISFGLSLTDNISNDFFVLYFLVVFLGALTERIGLVVGAAVVSSIVHLTTVSQFVGVESIVQSGYILRIPFLFVVALFFGHLVEEEARTREQMRAEFLSTVSHDLKNPVGVIQNQAELLLDGEAGPLAPEQATLIRHIHASARHVTTLSQNLLSAARIDAGRLILRPTAENLRHVVEAAVWFARSASDLKQISLRFSPDPDLPLVPVDPTQMERVVSNLLDNAIKYTPVGGAVEVSIHRMIGHLALVVRDNGPGIAPDRLPSLFEQYRQAGAHNVAGTGLGLFIVKAIAEAHGGTIEAESVPGAGTTMTVRLPTAGNRPAGEASALRRAWHRLRHRTGADSTTSRSYSAARCF
ncbi:MAG: hypothetical protein A3J75_08575 [Acidobacteria bacterium RBG_16_68_9]|nr:MAG: hypothetical protein A3J75_08575 [Acidobacteria bacterium RBG_16_68_9]